MYLDRRFPNNQPVRIVVTPETEELLARHCFRGGRRVAGNFRSWRCTRDVLMNRSVMKALLYSASRAYKRGVFRGRAVSDSEEFIGWTLAMERDEVPVQALETSHVFNGTTVLCVAPKRRDVVALETSEVTLVYRIKQNGDQIQIVVDSMFPGPDPGPLAGDATGNGWVFFSRDHPGE